MKAIYLKWHVFDISNSELFNQYFVSTNNLNCKSNDLNIDKLGGYFNLNTLRDYYIINFKYHYELCNEHEHILFANDDYTYESINNLIKSKFNEDILDELRKYFLVNTNYIFTIPFLKSNYYDENSKLTGDIVHIAIILTRRYKFIEKRKMISCFQNHNFILNLKINMNKKNNINTMQPAYSINIFKSLCSEFNYFKNDKKIKLHGINQYTYLDFDKLFKNLGSYPLNYTIIFNNNIDDINSVYNKIKMKKYKNNNYKNNITDLKYNKLNEPNNKSKNIIGLKKDKLKKKRNIMLKSRDISDIFKDLNI